MPEWLYEAGLGENRALLLEDGEAIEAHLEIIPRGHEPGDTLLARIMEVQAPGRRALVQLANGGEALLEPVPVSARVRQDMLVEILREPIFDGRVHKRAKARPAPPLAEAGAAPSLLARLQETGLSITPLGTPGPDRLEEAGWSEILEQADTGQVAFPGGSLSFIPTQAMMVVDVDGWLEPDALALAAAHAAGRAIRLFGIGGSTVIDFPTVSNKAVRNQMRDAVLAGLGPHGEATAVNGYGLMQIIRPRPRRSLLEQVRDNRPLRAAARLVRQAERSGLIGATQISAHPQVVAALEALGAADYLATRLGGTVTLATDASSGLWSGHVAKSR